jgi:hypothetical protein
LVGSTPGAFLPASRVLRDRDRPVVHECLAQDMRPAVDASGFPEERHRDAALASVPVITLTEPGTDCA